MIKKQTFCCSDQIYNILSKFFYFFRCIQLCVFSEMRKAPTFFYIKFLTYKHKPPINPLTIAVFKKKKNYFFDWICFWHSHAASYLEFACNELLMIRLIFVSDFIALNWNSQNIIQLIWKEIAFENFFWKMKLNFE